MAIVIKNTNYSGEVLEELLTMATTGNELVEKGLIHVIPEVSKKISIPRMKTTKMLQKRKEMPTDGDSKGDFEYSEKELNPVEFMAFTTFNPRSFEKIWRPYQPKGNLVFAELPQDVQDKLLSALSKQVKFELGYHYINGKEGTTDDELFNGIIFRMENDADTVKVATSSQSMIGKLEMIRKRIPSTMRTQKGLRYLMSIEDFDRYDAELTAQQFKGANYTDTNPERYKGITIVPLANWPTGKPVATITGMDYETNLWAGVNLIDDEDVIQIDKISNPGERYFFKMLMKADTNIAFGEEVIMLETVAPSIVSDKNTLSFTDAGGVEELEITATEPYTISAVSDGVSVVTTDTGVLISVEENTSGAPVESFVTLALKDHPATRVRIKITQD